MFHEIRQWAYAAARRYALNNLAVISPEEHSELLQKSLDTQRKMLVERALNSNREYQNLFGEYTQLKYRLNETKEDLKMVAAQRHKIQQAYDALRREVDQLFAEGIDQ